MSENESTQSNRLLTFIGALGAILIFALIILIAYLPNRPDPVNAEVAATRKAKAVEAIAQGKAKLAAFEVVNAEAGLVRIPIELAMEQTLQAYQRAAPAAVTAEPVAAPAAAEPAASASVE